MNEQAERSLEILLEGNLRYREGKNQHRLYEPHHREQMVQGQTPIAAVISCVDSRVTPEVIFDQPLGSIFVSRVPANVASDSAKWMIDIAVGDFKVPLVLVIGHTGCLAVKQIVDGVSGPGGLLRFKVLTAVSRAKMMREGDVWENTVRENAKMTIEHLRDECWPLRDAMKEGITVARAGVFNMASGEVEMLT